MFEGDHPNEIVLSNLLSSNMFLREYVWEKTYFELQSALALSDYGPFSTLNWYFLSPTDTSKSATCIMYGCLLHRQTLVSALIEASADEQFSSFLCFWPSVCNFGDLGHHWLERERKEWESKLEYTIIVACCLVYVRLVVTDTLLAHFGDLGHHWLDGERKKRVRE